MSVKHLTVVTARATRAIMARKALLNLLTYLFLNFLDITHVKSKWCSKRQLHIAHLYVACLAR